MSDKTLNKEMKLLCFNMIHLDMCVYLKHVIKVLPLMELQTVPDSPQYLTGLMNFHGKSIPVIDIADRLNIKRNALSYTVDTPMLLCKVGEKYLSLIIDEVTGVEVINTEALQLYSEFKEGLHFFKGVINDGNKPLLLLNMEYIVNMGFLEKYVNSAVDGETVNSQSEKNRN